MVNEGTPLLDGEVNITAKFDTAATFGLVLSIIFIIVGVLQSALVFTSHTEWLLMKPLVCMLGLAYGAFFMFAFSITYSKSGELCLYDDEVLNKNALTTDKVLWWLCTLALIALSISLAFVCCSNIYNLISEKTPDK